MCRHVRCALFRRAIDLTRDDLAVPVDQFRRVRVVVNIDDGLLPFLEAQQGSGKLAIVQRCRDDVLWRKLDEPSGDPQRVVRLLDCAFTRGRCQARHKTRAGNPRAVSQ